MYRKAIVTITILFLILSPVSYAQEFHEDACKELAELYFSHLKDADFLGASNLFHYPPTYSQQELDKDVEQVAEFLRYLHREFGKLNSYEPDTGLSLCYNISVGGGDLNYWKDKPGAHPFTYKADFEREREAYVCVQFCEINDKIEVRAVSYGLPISKPDSAQRISELVKGMMEIIEKPAGN